MYANIRQKGYEVAPCIDDSFLQEDTQRECWENVKNTSLLLQDLGFIIHPWPDESVFIPRRALTFLGVVIHSEEMTVKLTPDKQCPSVELCLLFYRTLENDKNDALKQTLGDFDAKRELSTSVKLELQWWIDNIHAPCGQENLTT